MRIPARSAPLLVLALAIAGRASAATFVVDSTLAGPDGAPGDGRCATVLGTCTVEAAVGESNASPGPDVVEVPDGFHEAALLQITEDLTIRGAASRPSVAGRPFSPRPGRPQLLSAADGVVLVLESLSLSGGASIPGDERLAGIVTSLGAHVVLRDCDLRGIPPPHGLVRANGGSLVMEGVSIEGSPPEPDFAFHRYPLLTAAGAAVVLRDATLTAGSAPDAFYAQARMTSGSLLLERVRLTGGIEGVSVTDGLLTLRDVAFDGTPGRSSWGAMPVSAAVITGEGVRADVARVSVGDGDGRGFDLHGPSTLRDVVVTGQDFALALWADGHVEGLRVADCGLGGFQPEGIVTLAGDIAAEDVVIQDSFLDVGAGGAALDVRAGDVRIVRAHIDGCRGGVRASGGALTLVDSSVTRGLPDRYGQDALRVGGGASAILRNCTLSSHPGSAVAAVSGRTHLEHVTISGTGESGLAAGPVATVILDHVVVAGGPVGCTGSVELAGPAWIEVSACATSGPGAIVSGDPALEPLAGLRTGTMGHAPRAGSPLIDAGWAGGAFPAADQRALRRPIDGDGDGLPVRDLGAVEWAAGPDTDGDGVGDPADPCPDVADDGVDADSDGIPDACDACTDSDGDGRGDPFHAASTCAPDACPGVPEPFDVDADGDGLGDACDPAPMEGAGAPDADSDGRPDAMDSCPLVPDDGTDADGDGLADACDPLVDIDGDGRGEGNGWPATGPADLCPTVAQPVELEMDSDGDLHGDACDNCPQISNSDQADGDGDGRGDACPPCTEVSGRGSATPLRVTRSGSELRLRWDGSGIGTFEIVEGLVSRLASADWRHEAVGCALDRPEALVPLPALTTFWLVGRRCGPARGTLGTGSSGAERPRPAFECP